jgi:hypothetical protein
MSQLQKRSDQKTAKHIPESSDTISPSQPSAPPRYKLKNLRALLKGLTNKELRRLCKDVSEFRPVYEQLRPSTGKAQIVRLLLDHAKQNSQVEILLAWAQEHTPARYEKYQPYCSDPATSPTTSERTIREQDRQDIAEVEGRISIETEPAKVKDSSAKSMRSEGSRQEAEERYRKKQIRRQIRDEFYLLFEKEKCEIDQIAEFIWKFNEEIQLMRDVLQPFKRSESFPAVMVWRYLSGETGELDQLILRQKLLAERKAWLEAKLPDPVVMPVEINEHGPRLDTLTPGRIHLLIEHLLGEGLQDFQIESDFPFAQIGDYPLQLEFSDGIRLSWTIRLELRQDKFPPDCLEQLKDISPIDLSEAEDILKQLQTYLAEVSPLDVLEYYPRMSAVLVTAYCTGYWKSIWVQKVLQEWRREREEYFSKLKAGEVKEEVESKEPSRSSSISTDKILGLSHLPDERIPVTPSAIKEFRHSARLIKQDLIECKAKEVFLGDVPANYTTLLREAKNYHSRSDRERAERFLQLAKVYAETGHEDLLRFCLAQYCFSTGRQRFKAKKRREARPYLQLFLLFYSQMAVAGRRDLVYELYNTLALYFGTYNIHIDVKGGSSEITGKFYSNLPRVLSLRASQKDLASLGRCIVEIAVANSTFVFDLINRMKMRTRKDATRALQTMADSLQEPYVFRKEPLQCLQLLARMDINRVPVALSRQSLSSADERRLVVIALLRFAISTTFPPNTILKGFARQASADTKTTLAFSLLVEPFVLSSPQKEKRLKAELMAEALGLPAGTQGTEYFLGRASNLADLFDKFARSSDSDIKGKYGYNILDTIRRTRSFLLGRLNRDLGDLIAKFLTRIQAYVTSEQAKLIHDTTLEIALVNDRALYSPTNTRITLEIRNVGEGTADGLELKVIPVEGQYKVDNRHRMHPIDILADKEPRQREIWIQPTIGVNQSLDLSVVLQYDTLTQKGKKAKLAEGNCTVWLYPEAQFVRVAQPYDIGKPATTWFYGRKHLLENMADSLRAGSGHDTSMIVYGIKRAGKTSVVKRFIEHTLIERGLNKSYISVYTDFLTDSVFRKVRTDGDFLYYLTQIMVQALPDQAQESKSFQNLSFFEGDFQRNPFDVFSLLLEDILATIKPRRLLLVLDEFSTLQEHFRQPSDASLTAEMFSFLSNVTQSTNQLTFIFTGTYVLLEMMREHAFDLAKICAPYMVGFLDEPSARRLVEEPVRRDKENPDRGWLEYDPRVVERIVSVTNCHPYLIQYLCKQLVDRMNRLKYNVVNLNDISSVIYEIISIPAHAVPMLILWDEFDTPQHRVLSVIAARSDSSHSWVSTKEIAGTFNELGDSTPLEDILALCSSLADAELLEKSASGDTSYRITVPLYQMWLKQNKPPIEVFGK